jgi:hypothetical protein
LLPYATQVQHRCDPAQQMIMGHVIFEAEVVEQRLLPVILASHHGVFPFSYSLKESRKL